MSNRPNLNNRSNRPRRSAVGGAGAGGLLEVTGKDENFVYRWVNDEGSRIAELKSYGYDIVQDKDIIISTTNAIQSGSSHSVVVDKKSGKKGVLMRQPIEFHKEDKKLRAQAIDKSEESMFRKLKTEDSRYGDVEQTNSLSKSVED